MSHSRTANIAAMQSKNSPTRPSEHRENRHIAQAAHDSKKIV